MKTVDLNADMGESFGEWAMGNDAALLKIVTSANVACGFHAGDPDVMAQTMSQAVQHGVGLGAHPGFPDLQGFGRRDMTLSHDSLRNLVAYQVGAAQAMAKAAGGALRHVKLHGALANMAAKDEPMARACYEGMLAVDSSLIAVVLAGTAQERAAEALDCLWAGEIFADRAYLPDATLVPRGRPGAVIKDPSLAAARVAAMVEAGAIIAEDGTQIPAAVDTICLHGDGPSALQIAAAVREALQNQGIALKPFHGRGRQSAQV